MIGEPLRELDATDEALIVDPGTGIGCEGGLLKFVASCPGRERRSWADSADIGASVFCSEAAILAVPQVFDDIVELEVVRAYSLRNRELCELLSTSASTFMEPRQLRYAC